MAEKDFRKSLVMLFAVATGLFALYYVFWGADLIPDGVGITIPQLITSYMDDALIVITAIFAFRRVKLRALPGKNKDGSPLWLAIFILLLAAALWYVFLGADLIPDGSPWFGFFDDLAAIVAAVGIGVRARRYINQL
jgi:uncharacterized membrane protein YkvA (DUF1232 family)